MITWGTIFAKIEADCILEDEQWIDEDECLGYANEAIKDAEAIVHSLYEDYFLDYATITFVAGTEEYDLPTNIYANKIRRFLFENGGNRYIIPRMQDWKKFERKSMNDYLATSGSYEYFVVSPTAGAESKIILSPTVQAADAGAFGKIWFIREANQLATASDTCDIPEFINYIYAHMKTNIYAKEGHPNLSLAMANLARQKELMEGTLTAMVPDADNEIEADLSGYEEMN